MNTNTETTGQTYDRAQLITVLKTVLSSGIRFEQHGNAFRLAYTAPIHGMDANRSFATQDEAVESVISHLVPVAQSKAA